jgi:hypothetical protein
MQLSEGGRPGHAFGQRGPKAKADSSPDLGNKGNLGNKAPVDPDQAPAEASAAPEAAPRGQAASAPSAAKHKAHSKHSELLRDMLLDNLQASRGRENDTEDAEYKKRRKVMPVTQRVQMPVEFHEDGSVKDYGDD